MADLTTIETQLINKGSPLSNDFSLGSRMQNMTTDGNYSSGTLDTPSLTDWNPPDATGSLSSAYWTTAGGLTAGAWNTTWAYIRIDTALDTGTVITITNLATATQLFVSFRLLPMLVLHTWVLQLLGCLQYSQQGQFR